MSSCAYLNSQCIIVQDLPVLAETWGTETCPGCLVYRPRQRPHSHCGLPLCVVDTYPRSSLENRDPSWSVLVRSLIVLPGCLAGLPGAAGGVQVLLYPRTRCVFLWEWAGSLCPSGLCVWEHGGTVKSTDSPLHFLPLLRGWVRILCMPLADTKIQEAQGIQPNSESMPDASALGSWCSAFDSLHFHGDPPC